MAIKKNYQKRNAYELMANMGRIFYLARRKIPPSLEAAFEKGTLNTRHVSVLNAIISSDSMSVSELSEYLNLSLSATSQLVSELSRTGYIDRYEDPQDRRRTVVCMSQIHGNEITEYVHFRAKPLLRVLKKLSEEDGVIFLKGIELLLDEMTKENV